MEYPLHKFDNALGLHVCGRVLNVGSQSSYGNLLTIQVRRRAAIIPVSNSLATLLITSLGSTTTNRSIAATVVLCKVSNAQRCNNFKT